MQSWLQHSPRCFSYLARTTLQLVGLTKGGSIIPKRNVTTAFVRCGLSGRIAVDLYNVESHPMTAPMVIYLPPCPQPTAAAGERVEVPEFLKDYVVAVINYRWSGFSFDQAEPKEQPEGPSPKSASDPGMEHLDPDSNGIRDSFPTPMHWPTPVHDTAFGYQWLVSNLSPSSSHRRDIYLYGTHLGATLASSLALTEAFPHRMVAIRGLAAYNGVYNWTMFLPGHPIYKPKPSSSDIARPRQHRLPPEGSLLHYLATHLQTLFDNPTNMFDPFASPSLFFHNPGMHVPLDFVSDVPAASELIHPAIMEKLQEGQAEMKRISGIAQPSIFTTLFGRPRRGTLVYPPRHSAIRIPNSLIMHDPSPDPPPYPPSATSNVIDDFLEAQARPSPARRRRMSLRALRRLPIPRMKSTTVGPVIDNTFAGHAAELVEQMRRSVNKYEFKDRCRDAEAWEIESMVGEAEQRVKLSQVELGSPGAVAGWLDIPPNVEEMAAVWLEEQIKNKKAEKEAQYEPWRR